MRRRAVIDCHPEALDPLAVMWFLRQADIYPRGRERNAYLSSKAREAAVLSARHFGIRDLSFAKSEDGVPVAEQGVHWSLSHKTDAVAGIVHKGPVGIDIERIRPIAAGMFDMIAQAAEWRLLADMERFERFFRVWTAKEAALKAMGIGLRGLSRCSLESRSADCLRLRVDQTVYYVYQQRCRDHLVSVAVAMGRTSFRWEEGD